MDNGSMGVQRGHSSRRGLQRGHSFVGGCKGSMVCGCAKVPWSGELGKRSMTFRGCKGATAL